MPLYAKDPYEEKYQLLINKRESADLKYLNYLKAFIEYPNDMDNIYKNIEKYNPLKVFSDKKLNPIVTESFIRGRKINISLVFITQSYLGVPKNIKLNSIHYFLMKTSNKPEL